MKRFSDKPLLSRQPFSVVVTTLVLCSLLLQPLSLFAKPVAGKLAEELALTAPTLKAPAPNAKTTGVTYPPVGVPKLEWEPVAGAQKYGVEVSTSVGFAVLLVTSDSYGTTYTPQKALADGEYFWRVRAYDGKNWGPYSEIRSFIKDWSDDGKLRVELVSPPEGAQRAAFTNDDFIWLPISGAAMYNFEISTDPSFSNVVYTDKTIKAQHTPIKRLPNNLYYWRVTPIDNQNHFGMPSAVRSFNFAWDIAPQLLSPAADADLAFVPSFAWTAVEAARKYELQISSNPNDFSLASFYQTTNTEYTPEKALSNDADYFWRVKAIDYENASSPWSEVRRFRAKWNFQTQLLAPVNSTIAQGNPFFSWTTIPGAERYQVRVDESSSFDKPLMNKQFYNVTTAAIVEIEETTIYPAQDYFWQVRGIDTQGNYTPWSDSHTFRYSFRNIGANPVYPLPYYTPDTANLPVHSERTIAWPLFVWDSALMFTALDYSWAVGAAYYELAVSSDPNFQSIQFQIETTGPAAAPTLSHPFTNLQDGTLYYWRVRAYTAAGDRLGVDHVWQTRIDRQIPQLPPSTAITPIYPRDGFETIISPPLLGWLPVTGANNYRVQVSSDPNFNIIVDEAEPQFVNYAPGQGRRTLLSNGAYWWRVRAESSPGVVMGGWSEVRRFHLSKDLITGNPNDFVPPPYGKTLLNSMLNPYDYSPEMTYVAASTATVSANYDITDLHIMLNRVSLWADDYPASYDNLSWIVAFGVSTTITSTVQYGLYIDADHVPNSGATNDPLGKSITVDSLYLPEYVIYINPSADGSISPLNIILYSWVGTGWGTSKNLASIGGHVWYSDSSKAVQLLIPYGAIGANAENFVGSVAVTVFSTKVGDTSGMVDTIPPQATTINRPAFVGNMLMPLYPFDTPSSNPIVYNDVPPMRWRMPYYDSVDGYEVQVARDAKFTDLVETWEQSEKNTSPLYSFLTTSFQPRAAYEDNESYYWRVRMRYERYSAQASQFDYSPWSPAMRFKLESRQVGHPTLSTGTLANTTPTFRWDRVEGASGYKIQIDNDSNFSSPIFNRDLSGTSYTPITPLADGTYYWRVATRRSSAILGQWTPTMSFVKQSLTPTPLSPINSVVVNTQPTFKWTAILTPTAQPRVAAPLYRLQIDKDPNFGDPMVFTTESTALTLPESKSIADGTWYWRVAVIDSTGNIGAFSRVQQFYKEYLAPKLLQPGQNGVISGATSFEWAPVEGAAYYRIEIDDDPLFNSSLADSTDNTKYTPTKALTAKEYYWRVRIYDQDGKPGPFVTGRVQIQAVSLSLGNYVWLDNNNDGKVDSDEPPVPNGVLVELLDGAGAPLNQTTQTTNGFYRFTGLNIGEYRVRLAASNFAAGGLLQLYSHSTGVNQEGDPNSDGDQNDNGLDATEPSVGGIMSAKIMLTQAEPTGELPTASGTAGDDGAGTVDTDSNLTIDFGVAPSANFYSLGNFVGADANNDGQIDIDTTQKAVPVPNGVLLELLNGDGTPTGRTTTTVNGYYLFSGLAAGNYQVRIAASNFAVGGVIENYQHSTGASQEANPNNNGDQNDNGVDGTVPATSGITSGIITLGDNEPTGESPAASGLAGDDGRGTLDTNSNLTVDFGLIPGKPTASAQAIYLPVIRR